MTDLNAAIDAARGAFAAFASRCMSGESTYRLTPSAEPSPYARCFGVYCHHLAGVTLTASTRDALASAIRADVRAYRRQDIDPRAKPFRQLLTFSLSALSALGVLAADPLDELVEEQVPDDVAAELESYGCLSGAPGSGNQAMFTAIFLLHARDHLRKSTGERLQKWIALHTSRMNRFGFWGSNDALTYLQFQNGYHQYEILEYVGVPAPRRALSGLRSLADRDGHFAPYPGGGGCYDYDAVFLLTPEGRVPDSQTRALLERTAMTLLAEQRPDGGFAESLHVRPRGTESVRRMVRHIASAPRDVPVIVERLRYAMALQRPKHNRIHTHWSVYSRRWDESDLWDSWFRMLTLARIQTALEPAAAATWGFIDNPGIGYHTHLRIARVGS
jgi:hypothetical protein